MNVRFRQSSNEKKRPQATPNQIRYANLHQNLPPFTFNLQPKKEVRSVPDRTSFFYAPAGRKASSTRVHSATLASEGMRQSPLGDRDTVPTLGPSGRQERLNCWVKKRQ